MRISKKTAFYVVLTAFAAIVVLCDIVFAFYFLRGGFDPLTPQIVDENQLYAEWYKALCDIKELAEDHPEINLDPYYIWRGNGEYIFPEENYAVVYVNFMTPEQENFLRENYDLSGRIRLERTEEKLILD
ncbi:MAG: hypothetical protein IJF53_08800 [Clostridia bacterium]|nr:hypothetical protein [Clostridia bacterium]